MQIDVHYFPDYLAYRYHLGENLRSYANCEKVCM